MGKMGTKSRPLYKNQTLKMYYMISAIVLVSMMQSADAEHNSGYWLSIPPPVPPPIPPPASPPQAGPPTSSLNLCVQNRHCLSNEECFVFITQPTLSRRNLNFGVSFFPQNSRSPPPPPPPPPAVSMMANQKINDSHCICIILLL